MLDGSGKFDACRLCCSLEWKPASPLLPRITSPLLPPAVLAATPAGLCRTRILVDRLSAAEVCYAIKVIRRDQPVGRARGRWVAHASAVGDPGRSQLRQPKRHASPDASPASQSDTVSSSPALSRAIALFCDNITVCRASHLLRRHRSANGWWSTRRRRPPVPAPRAAAPAATRGNRHPDGASGSLSRSSRPGHPSPATGIPLRQFTRSGLTSPVASPVHVLHLGIHHPLREPPIISRSRSGLADAKVCSNCTPGPAQFHVWPSLSFVS